MFKKKCAIVYSWNIIKYILIFDCDTHFNYYSNLLLLNSSEIC